MDLFLIIYLINDVALFLLFPYYLHLFFKDRKKSKQEKRAPHHSFFVLFLYLFCVASIGIFIISESHYTLSEGIRPREVGANLKAIYSAQENHFKKNGRYASGRNLFSDIDWQPEGMNRFSYYCGESIVPCRSSRECDEGYPVPGKDWPFPIIPTATEQGYLCFAIAQLDKDPTLAVWIIDHHKNLIEVVNDKVDCKCYDLEQGRSISFYDRIRQNPVPYLNERVLPIITVLAFPLSLLLPVLLIMEFMGYRDREVEAGFPNNKNDPP